MAAVCAQTRWRSLQRCSDPVAGLTGTDKDGRGREESERNGDEKEGKKLERREVEGGISPPRNSACASDDINQNVAGTTNRLLVRRYAHTVSPTQTDKVENSMD